MAAEHWFDSVHTTLTQAASRRGALGAAITLVAALVTNDTRVTQAKRNKKKRRKDKKKANQKKAKPQPDPAQTCSGGACAAEPEWAGNQDEIDYCELICQQCDGDDPREFCIRHGTKPDGTPTMVAVCCDEGAECCGGFCCGSPHYRCCGGRCVNITQSLNHCNGCNQRCPTGASCGDGGCRCPEGQIECNDACIAATVCPDDGCGESCTGPGLQCCDGFCEAINFDEENCGGCGQTCIGPGLQCCNGVCVSTRTDPNHCDRCFNNRPGNLCCGGYLYDPTRAYCCPDGLRPCDNTASCCFNSEGLPTCCSPEPPPL